MTRRVQRRVRLLVGLPDVIGFACLIVAVVGLVGASQFEFTALNAHGHPRWLGTALTVLAAAVALYSRRPDLVFRLLFAFWAATAACFARPGLRELGIPMRFDVVLILIALAVAVAARHLMAPRAIRVALIGAVAAFVAVLVGILILPERAPVGDALVLGAILAVMMLSVRAAALDRRLA